MIGYYVHHQGRGHVHRAAALAAELGEPVVGLSSAPRPEGWTGDWVLLERDDRSGRPQDPSARGRLHWVPLHDEGLSQRMAELSSWFATARPRCVVVDVSVEVALLARLHGLPVVTVVLPGRRNDEAHRLGLDLAQELVGFWPPSATDGLLPDLPDRVRRRVRAVGGLSRFPVLVERPRRPGPPRVLVVSGAGGPAFDVEGIARDPGWEWTAIGGAGPGWHDDPAALVADADVVVTHAGQNALAEVAAARRPAIVVPQARPHREQRTTADVLRSGRWPALVEDHLPRAGWGERLEAAAGLDGTAWSEWVDGGAAPRFAAVVAS